MTCFGTSLTIRSSRRTPKGGFCAELEPRRDPTTRPSTPASAIERMQAGTDGGVRGRLVVRALQHGVLRLERRTCGPRARGCVATPSADTARGSAATSQPPSHGSSPSAGTTSRSRARVAATYASRTPSARSRATSSSSCMVQLVRRPAADLHRAQPARRHRDSGSHRAAACGRSDRRGSTTGNSRPLALCTVIMRTPSLPSSRIGASAASAAAAASRSSSMKARNEMPPLASNCRASSARGARWRAPARRPAQDERRRARASPRAGARWCRRPGGSCGPGAAAAAAASASAIGRRCDVGSAAERQLVALLPPSAVGIRNGWNAAESCRNSRSARRRARRAALAASRTPTARRPATRSRRAPPGASRPLRARGTPCRRPARAGCRAPRARDVGARDVVAEADEAPEEQADVPRLRAAPAARSRPAVAR